VINHNSLDFAIFRTLAKIFVTFSKKIIKECRLSFNIPDAADLVKKQKVNVLMRYLCKSVTRAPPRRLDKMDYN
jgi:hypothetical protein